MIALFQPQPSLREYLKRKNIKLMSTGWFLLFSFFFFGIFSFIMTPIYAVIKDYLEGEATKDG